MHDLGRNEFDYEREWQTDFVAMFPGLAIRLTRFSLPL